MPWIFINRTRPDRLQTNEHIFQQGNQRPTSDRNESQFRRASSGEPVVPPRRGGWGKRLKRQKRHRGVPPPGQ